MTKKVGTNASSVPKTWRPHPSFLF